MTFREKLINRIAINKKQFEHACNRYLHTGKTQERQIALRYQAKISTYEEILKEYDKTI